jgi:hypothetical protein
MLAKISQVLKTINAGFVSVAPSKVQRVTTHDREIVDLNFVRDCLWFQRPLSRPFVYALGAWTRATQLRRFIIAHPPIAPGDPQKGVAFLRNLSRLNRLSSLSLLGNVNHFVLEPSLTATPQPGCPSGRATARLLSSLHTAHCPMISSNAASTASALICPCEAVHSTSRSRTIKTCGVSCSTPVRAAISSERARAFCTTTSPTGLSICDSWPWARALTPQESLCLKIIAGEPFDSAMKRSSESASRSSTKPFDGDEPWGLMARSS